MDSLLVSASAKINLFLEVTGKRADGYHDIDSVFQEISLADSLWLLPRTDGEITLACNNADIPLDGRNLVWKAVELLRQTTGCRQGVDIVLEKRIPVGGGLGGGSGNAASALMALNKLWGLKLGLEDLSGLAAQLGSDVPYFLYGGACWCRGRGEQIEMLPQCEAQSSCRKLVIIAPEWGVSTALAYGALDKSSLGKHGSEAFRAAMAKGCGLEAESFNRFEEAVFRLEPREDRLYAQLSGIGFSQVRMSGSGSTLFGFIPENGDGSRLRAACDNLPGVKWACIVDAVARNQPRAVDFMDY